MKPRGYWKTGPGAETLAAVGRSELTRNQAAEMEGVSEGSISGAIAVHVRGKRNRKSLLSTAKFKVTRIGQLEKAIELLTDAAEEFASAVLKEANSNLLRQIQTQESTIAGDKAEIAALRDALDSFRAAAKSADRERAQKILKRAGLEYGD